MKISFGKRLLQHLVEAEPCLPAPSLPLAEAIEQARREWVGAQKYYDSVSESDLVDHAVYLLQAAEKKYMYLLRKARDEGLTHALFRNVSE